MCIAGDGGPVESTTVWTTVGPYHVLDATCGDQPDGPTHQPGVRPGRDHEPLRTPFGAVGLPGAGIERNVTDLDLTNNRHPATGPFGQK